MNTQWGGVLARLDVGVAVFFVLSGFLLSRPHIHAWLTGKPRPAVRRYVRHRVLRIAPPLWITVALVALLVPESRARGEDLILHMALVQIYAGVLDVEGLTQMWSLATEVSFYIVLPLIAAAVFRGPATTARVNRLLAGLSVTPLVGAAWMAWATTDGGGRTTWLPGFVGWFGLGIAIALWRSARQEGLIAESWLDQVSRRSGTCWALAAALLWLSASRAFGPHDLALYSSTEAAAKNLTFAVIGALLLLPCVALPHDHRADTGVAFLSSRGASWLGDISYGIFCYHLVILLMVEKALDYQLFTGNYFALFVPTVLVSIGVAAASFYGVERPLMRWGRRNETPSPPRTATAMTKTASS